MKSEATKKFSNIQLKIFSALEKLDPTAEVISDEWKREPGGDGGGGLTRIIKNGTIFEKAGVNFSEVHGEMNEDLAERLTGKREKQAFFATGTSLVIHPFSPMIPTAHANVRYLEVGNLAWFGGGMDLTPYYLFPEDASHFHSVCKHTCDKHNGEHYPKFKKWCDEYFYIPHREEARGVGGLFFDYLGKEDGSLLQTHFDFTADVGSSFNEAYLPIVETRMNEPWTESEKQFQLLRRGRYVEFNLIYDRGTLFGLKTGGRIESILMSLPYEVRWDYNASPTPGSREHDLVEVLKNPRDWV